MVGHARTGIDTIGHFHYKHKVVPTFK